MATLPDSTDTHYTQSFLGALVALGVSKQQTDNAMRAAQAKHGRFWTDELGMYAVQTFTRALADELGEPALGLRLAHAMPDGATGVIEYLLLSAPTLRATHGLYARYGSLISEYARYKLHEHGGYTTVSFEPPTGLVMDRVIEDFRLVRMLTSTRRALLEPELTPSAVHFSYARPAQLSAHEQAFGKTSFVFGCAAPGIQVPTHLLDRPLRTSEPVLHAILLQHAEHLLDRNAPTPNLSARVRQLLVASLHQGKPSCAEIARRMNMSERSLRRHLATDGTSFADLLDEVRASLAGVLAKTPDHASKAMASKLGFESPSALRRAQKRWATRAAE